MDRPRIQDKAAIEYPCRWIYKIFGTDQARLRDAVMQLIPGDEYTLSPSHSSTTGKYHCMNLEITVMCEEDREGIYEALREHHTIVLVL